MSNKSVLKIVFLSVALCAFTTLTLVALPVQAQEIECVRTPGYWKNHAEEWPVPGLELGYAYYTQAELLGMLKDPVKGDMIVILKKHLIAAKLNVETSFSTNPLYCYASIETWNYSITDVMEMADYYLQNEAFPEGYEFKGTLEDIKDILDTFNNGPEGICEYICNGGGGDPS